MAVKATDSTPQQKSNYQEANLTTQQGLEESIDLMIQRKGVTNDPKEMEKIAVQLPRSKASLLNVDADLTAYLANSLVINPPSDGDVVQIKKTTEDIFKLTAQSDTADTIIAGVTNLLNQYGKTKA